MHTPTPTNRRPFDWIFWALAPLLIVTASMVVGLAAVGVAHACRSICG